jgi:hypothetical protein
MAKLGLNNIFIDYNLHYIWGTSETLPNQNILFSNEFYDQLKGENNLILLYMLEQDLGCKFELLVFKTTDW